MSICSILCEKRIIISYYLLLLKISQKKKEIEKEVTHLREENTSLKGKIIEQKQQEQGQASEVEALKKKAEEAEVITTSFLIFTYTVEGIEI